MEPRRQRACVRATRIRRCRTLHCPLGTTGDDNADPSCPRSPPGGEEQDRHHRRIDIELALHPPSPILATTPRRLTWVLDFVVCLGFDEGELLLSAFSANPHCSAPMLRAWASTIKLALAHVLALFFFLFARLFFF